MTRSGAQRLLALVLALGLVSVAPTVVANLVTGRSATPPAWAAAVCTAYLAVFVVLLVQAVRRGACGPAAWALVVVGDVALATYPVVSPHVDDDVPWVLALSAITVGAGAVAAPSLGGALGLTAVHLLLRQLLQLSGVWSVRADIAVVETVGQLVIAVAASVAVQAVQESARSVEQARDAAARAAAAAAAARAEEVENSRWDGIVHDDVLASLSTAAHARDAADRGRARAAAERALASVDGGLAGARDTGPVGAAETVSRLRSAVLALHPGAVLSAPDAPAGQLAPEAVDALVAATAEAVRNAVRHGSRAGRVPDVRVRVRADARRGRFGVEVRDDGAGFDARRATPRLGLAVSVRRRADVVGGRALVRSAPGVGTVVLLGVPLLGTSAEGAG
ncbi:ATP-binding protein [Kineococcus radiotolerans]|uniref:Signal transduction histidine kinase n=1 Tax=Kineococcus radiotolerans (strain ATCC BAA-149 / DSM 14245 / SRS30216) TaxID=266940 RepID=A6W6Y8_KINRD|nr:ATP-binding protein [Kineococcus radiotolerans]ABS02577.1 putative signal transduction histidine kinase [Kineococcus radiotolerans SRS30216 = ATCC BAA-149]